MHQQAKEAPTDAAGAAQLESAAGSASARHWRDAALWRALAGMAISFALACVIVMLEFTGQAAYRADRMHRHADALRARISRLESEVAAERVRISTAHRELAAAQELRAILRAPDADMLALAPSSAPGARVVVAPGAGASRRPQATLALAPRERRAVLIVAGLRSSANDAVFVLWWSAPHRAPVRAVEFRTEADGSALVTAALPAALEVTAAMVTAEHGAQGGAAANAGAAASNVAAGAEPAVSAGSAPVAPAGPVLLCGTLAR
jgi:hypothetical protein